MTLLIFPSFPGIKQAQSKRPEIKSQFFENPLSGRESRLRFQLYPKYYFTLDIDYLMQTASQQESKQLLGFMAQVGGKTEAFLYLDPNDNAVDYQVIGVGTGSAVAYQLTRSLGDYAEAIQNPVASTVTVYVDTGEGFALVDAADYTLSDTGLITFDTAPADEAVIAWTGQYYHRVRLAEDGFSVDTVYANIAQCSEISFVGSVRSIV